MEDFVRTVLGDIKAGELNWCQCHEHIFLEKCRSYEVSPDLLMQDYDKSLAELKEYKSAGGYSLVDAQPAFSGRIINWLKDASRESRVNIIASTGFHKTVFYYEDSPIFKYGEQQLTDFFISEIERGAVTDAADQYQRTDVRTGIIKTAADSGGIYADSTYVKLFEAAAAAAQETGAPVITHIERGADALQIIEFFAKRKIAPARLILCHLDRARYDFNYHKECADTGAFLEYDTINRIKYHDDKSEADLIIYMFEQGFLKSLLLGLDTTNKRLRNYNSSDMGLDYIIKDFAPYLMERGARKDDIETVMTDNPKRALKFANIIS